MFSLPVSQSQYVTTGAAAGVPLAVPGLLPNDVILGIATYIEPQQPRGLNPSDFTVSAGSISSASVDTAGQTVAIIWGRGHPA